MKFERAKEIFEAPDSIKVMYGGSPVWIEELFENDESARVHLETTDQHQTVPVSELVEQ